MVYNCQQLEITSLIHCGRLQRWWKFNTCSIDSNAYLFYVSFAGLGLERADLGLRTAGLGLGLLQLVLTTTLLILTYKFTHQVNIMPKTATHAESQTNIVMQCVHQATMSKMANITLARRLIELITAALTTNYRSHIIVRKDDHTYYISLHWIIQFRTTITAAQSRWMTKIWK